MELAWAILRHDSGNARLLARYVRCLRRTGRLRDELELCMQTGRL